MLKDNQILLAKNDHEIYLRGDMANRHGLIAGTTGSGKTVTLKVMAEGFSSMGVPVFFSDVKGDLSGVIQMGEENENVTERVQSMELNDFSYQCYPAHFWDIFGEQGHPVRVSISDMGPILLSRLLELSDAQSGVLSIVFRIADEMGLMLIDLMDLRSMLEYVGEHKDEYKTKYGNVTTASIGAIQRALLKLEDEGANQFFGIPALDIFDWIKTDAKGRGMINILNCKRLIQSPVLYSTFLLWMLSELYERLPEVGDLDVPRMIFFFDEAHLLFKGAPSALVNKVTQIVKLIRSKGVGIYFISQSPSDIPDEVLAQLSNRVQHALRAYTPSETKAVKAAAQSFRPNPAFKSDEAITELKVGEALISCLDEDGAPQIVQRAKILPPQSKMGAADESLIKKAIVSSEFELKYRDAVDPESAYEVLAAQQNDDEEVVETPKAKIKEKAKEKETTTAKRSAGRPTKSTIEKALNSATSSVSRTLSTNVAKTLTGGKTTSTQKMIERAATNALSTLLREGGKSVTRGLFGTRK